MRAIRVHAEEKDLIEAISMKLLNTATEHTSIGHLQDVLKDDRTFLFVAENAGEVIGYALIYSFPYIYPNQHLSYLYDIEVLDEYRQQGAGTVLIETALAYLQAVGISELWLGTATDNAAAQRLFSKTGAVKSGETFNDFTYEL